MHIKDGYFFEIPKFLWRQHYGSLENVPKFLREAHPQATLAEFDHEMSGKILIPQPFGTLKNLHDRQSGFCIGTGASQGLEDQQDRSHGQTRQG